MSSPAASTTAPLTPEQQLLAAFRTKYAALQNSVTTTIEESAGDSVVIARLGDQLDEFARAIRQVRPPLPESSHHNLILLLERSCL